MRLRVRHVEIGKIGLLQMKRGTAGEMLRGEIEEGEIAEMGLVRIVGIASAGDGGGGDEVLTGQIECDIGVGTIGHLYIEDDVAATQAQITDLGDVAVELFGFAERNGVGELMAVLIEAKIFQGTGGVREDGGNDDGTALTGAVR